MSNASDFTIKTEVFEGPLELLLSLIEKRKLLINDISLAKVTDDYIVHIKEMERLSLKKTSHFILIASTLLLIKSKSLLPSLELTEDEQESIEDLEKRLILYKKYKELSLHIEERFGKNITFGRQEIQILERTFAPSKQINLQNIYSSVINLMKSLPKKEIIPKAVVQKVISLEDMIGRLTKRIQAGLQMSFREFAGVGKEEKINVIVGFLAMLELVKEGVLHVKQESRYDDIHMETNDITTPQY